MTLLALPQGTRVFSKTPHGKAYLMRDFQVAKTQGSSLRRYVSFINLCSQSSKMKGNWEYSRAGKSQHVTSEERKLGLSSLNIHRVRALSVSPFELTGFYARADCTKRLNTRFGAQVGCPLCVNQLHCDLEYHVQSSNRVRFLLRSTV